MIRLRLNFQKRKQFSSIRQPSVPWSGFSSLGTPWRCTSESWCNTTTITAGRRQITLPTSTTGLCIRWRTSKCECLGRSWDELQVLQTAQVIRYFIRYRPLHPGRNSPDYLVIGHISNLARSCLLRSRPGLPDLDLPSSRSLGLSLVSDESSFLAEFSRICWK